MLLVDEPLPHVACLTLNRPEKRNAFDAALIQALTQEIEAAIANPQIRIILLKGAGKHFSAGADLAWMQRMSQASQKENETDARQLATLLHTLYHCPKPTLAQVQGSTYGGGLGLIAACDMAFADTKATFCFSEVKLGLIPAVISPFIIQAMGARTAQWLFMTAESFNAAQAQAFNLIQHCLPLEELTPFVNEYASQLAALPPEAVKACKALVKTVASRPIDESLLTFTAAQIAAQRQSPEAKAKLAEFLSH